MIHGGVRWKTFSCATSGWICGTNWIADAPVPITATRSPARSWSWFHSAECHVSPSKRSMPSSSGIDGSLRPPMPATTTSASKEPLEVSMCQRERSSSQSIRSTSHSVCRWRRTSKSVAQRFR